MRSASTIFVEWHSIETFAFLMGESWWYILGKKPTVIKYHFIITNQGYILSVTLMLILNLIIWLKIVLFNFLFHNVYLFFLFSSLFCALELCHYKLLCQKTLEWWSMSWLITNNLPKFPQLLPGRSVYSNSFVTYTGYHLFKSVS